MIRIGPAGWDYPDWQGVVYPPKIKGTERLVFLSQFFLVVEINVTFYRPLSPVVSRRWLEAVAEHPDFRFTAKLLQVFTHDRTAAAWQAEASVKAGLEPLLLAGRLGVLLAQFPYSFHHTEANQAYLVTLRQHFADYPLAVEVRHRSWQRPEVRQFLHDQHLEFCNIDQPQVSYALGTTNWVTGNVGYLRLHGRNRRAWFGKLNDPHARYDYLYDSHELAQLEHRARELAAQATETYLIFNNHPHGQAVANALEMIKRLRPGRLLLPESLKAAFPRLIPLEDVVEG
ncbi:MAG: DUF72 domain-containing protein [Deltaproteobacteria bacterium]|nr:DUF72 domain-containing protein [Deltaproteobacteria bacterium]